MYIKKRFFWYLRHSFHLNYAEKIQRRCNVKERKRKQELKENGGEYVVSNFDVGSPAMALAERKRALLMQYPTQFSQVTQQEVLAQYPNIVPSHDRGLGKWTLYPP